ncbi:multiple sugar transport system substrate-binding protein [Paenibacillus catalpae]|uniref:Multiple sugar transport system substrate-binding protein n=1 Tax=Paenibacillus catalpae TaxID=1045775 RepID=A0A1I1U2H7_9BACL|nr:sugar ABC transporter substrate-binding protein [Paenibacillus catalpae]SFD65032.1 multiple sugar transport system substrate-binding protein [Paenibacillus catalpae]
MRKLQLLQSGWTGLLIVAALAGCSYSSGQKTGSAVGGGNSGGGLEGRTITFVTGSHPWVDVIKPLLPEFEEETGINVRIQGYFEDQLTQKLTVQFAARSETPDVFMYRPLQEGKLFFRNGWLEPLDAYATRDAEYELGDFSPASIRSSTVDGKLAGIPIVTEQQILYYRKDLLQEAGIAVPTTIGELKAAAAKLNHPERGVYGFVARGQRSPLVTQLSSFLYSEGGDFIRNGKAAINTPEALKAFETYGGLLRDYGPPNVINMSWPQASAFFSEGKAALYTDANSIYRAALDPERSKVAGEVGFAPFPAGEKGSMSYNITSWGLAINPKSVDKEAAWTFVEWASGKAMMLLAQQAGNPGPRSSVWNDPQGTIGFPDELASVFKQTINGGVDHDRPQTVDVAAAREQVGKIVQMVITGEPDIRKAADQANAALQAILDEEAE